LLDTRSEDRLGDLEVGVPIEDLLDTGTVTAKFEEFD
jgi:hypothetical protein